MKKKKMMALGLAAMLMAQSVLPVLAEEVALNETEIIEEIPEDELTITEEILLEETEIVPEEVIEDEMVSAEISDEELEIEAEKAAFKTNIVTISKVESWGYQAAKVSWSNLPDADGYRLYVQPEGSKWQYVKETMATSYVQNGLTSGKTYTYYVRAFRWVDGEKIWTAYSQGKSVAPIPKRPAISKIIEDRTSAKIIWKDVAGATGYRIAYRVTGTTKWTFVADVPLPKLDYTQTNLKNGESYDYIMRAYRTVNGKKVYSRYSDVATVKLRKPALYELEIDNYNVIDDISGDGYDDEIFYEYDQNTGEMEVYINSQFKKSLFAGRGGVLYVCRYGSTEAYLVNVFIEYGRNSVEVYRYIGGQLKKVNSKAYFADRTLSVSQVWKVYGDWLYIASAVLESSEFATFERGDMAPIVNSRFKLSNGKYILSARTLTVIGNDIYQACTSFPTSTSRTTINLKGPYVHAGDIVSVQKVYLPTNGEPAYFQISVNGKTGWFKDSKNALLWNTTANIQ